MLSADEELIARTKKDVGIWNINSFGEYYLQIAEKYKGDYAQALRRLRECRTKLADALTAMGDVRVIPSQANYLMLELTGNASATEVTERLLCDENVLVKDLTAKVQRSGRQYLRVAVRDEADNARLVDALRKVLG